MPAKYSHVKKRASAQQRKSNSTNHTSHSHLHFRHPPNDHRNPNPHLDRQIGKTVTEAMTAVSQLERAIARILLKRFEQDIARLYSTHLYFIALYQLPTFIMRCTVIGGPGWVAYNADCDEIKDFFRSVISMDLRQAGERVATKSVLWSYTALRHFAISHNVPICKKRGLHSVRLLPHYQALQAHLDSLESMPPPTFTKPPHLGPMTEGFTMIEEACRANPCGASSEELADRLTQLGAGYDRICETIWRVACEFDVRGYGGALREKLTTKWCDCGCSTDHLSEVCEKTVREEEDSSGIRPGKEREWDGRGSGVLGWGTEDEEDLWEVDFDVNPEPGDNDEKAESSMNVNELTELRYLKAEREKELGNAAFKKGDFEQAVKLYEAAHQVEPEMSHYQLNLAAAHLKLHNYAAAELACDLALGQHRSVKGYWRRAQARKAQGRMEGAIQDLRSVLKIQPTNAEALTDLSFLLNTTTEYNVASRSQPSASSSSSAQANLRAKRRLPKTLPFPRTDYDNYRLKISPLPLTIDIPVDLPYFSHLGDSGGKEKSGKPVKPENSDKPTSPSSLKTRPETFTYPSWERYVVRKLSS
ncbi:uncharacterized protein FIBRA_06389 [Fibroporia radiculosa]|uniref:Uncharacterized protein n=1 Tax=Fibroporia radiculosa TaxID=599839 RepID=J4HZ11_9APHY|nr:uncharacterized protein FIBRA_06389 [Fibroporia radiculosa]CCM04222.1 predicted protein [Fibroporia radiculosa]